jgi:hypothetical protein
MSAITNITIIGAGPYGLSLAAHLKHYGMDFRIIGSPMRTWRTHMPKGMYLKSAGISATLFDPERKFSLKNYCINHSIPYEDEGLPISLELFTHYGLAFQQYFAPNLEDTKLQSLTRCKEGFELKLDNGAMFKSKNVVLAVGIDYFRNLPTPIFNLPKELYSHSAEHHELEKFKGKNVVVIGSGSSAIDMAVLLHEIGAYPTLVARRAALNFGQKEGKSRNFLGRLFAPMSGLGPGWFNLFCASAPSVFRHLPERLRCKLVKEFLGPSGGWFIRNRLKPVNVILGQVLISAKVADGKAHLIFNDKDGLSRDIISEHVITATGYKAELKRMSFLSQEMQSSLALIGETPKLSGNFESTISGLYFAGPTTATSFGPVMRFAVGAGFSSKTISKWLYKTKNAAPKSTQAQLQTSGSRSVPY